MGLKLAAIGECMIEMSHGSSSQLDNVSLGYGGDTLNTLIYAARHNIESFFFTALGEDPYSQWLVAQWKHESINTDYVRTVKQKLPGLYAIQLDDQGERQFFYWRENSAAKELMTATGSQMLLAQLQQMDVIYLSGISLSILSDSHRALLIDIIAKLHQQGKIIAFDGNYRPKNWHNREQALYWCKQVLQYTTWYLPTLDDELTLFALPSKLALLAQYKLLNIPEIALKAGAEGCYVIYQGHSSQICVDEQIAVKDTTAAGDSFNAGYLAARMNGLTPDAAAKIGNQVAGQVIQHQGAIVPAENFRPATINSP